ncbi:hypothetical protein EQ832_22915 [Pseudomonas sp. ALS1131]|nr:hypothetical protein [Pseudomonas sp. ALS1131]TRO32607.1 hypothetical protein EQ832_22915 [Pseudomonas sp. ALS1131]
MTSAPPFFLIAIVIAPLMWCYLILLGGFTLKIFGKNPKASIERPYWTMLQASLLSFLIFLLASAPILAANIAIPGTTSFSIPYTACLFVAGFIVFIQKISTVTTGTQQVLICAGLAGLIAALFTTSQYLLDYALLG